MAKLISLQTSRLGIGQVLRKGHTLREVPHPLHPKPKGLHARLPVALAFEKSAETGDQSDQGIERRRLLRRPLLGEELGGPPLVGREQQCSIEPLVPQGDASKLLRRPAHAASDSNHALQHVTAVTSSCV